MKKSLLTLFAALAFFTSNAQTSAGTLFIGGGLGISSQANKVKNGGTTTDGPKQVTFLVEPQVGYFIMDKFALRLGLMFQNTNYKTTNYPPAGPVETKNVTNTFGIELGGRYYLMLNDNFGFTGELALGARGGKTRVTANSTTEDGDKTSAVAVGIYPGIVYFPSPKVGIEATFGSINSNSYLLGFTSMKTTSPPAGNGNETVSTDNSFDFGFNSLRSLNFTFNYYFAR
jgi:hypothetical protein